MDDLNTPVRTRCVVMETFQKPHLFSSFWMDSFLLGWQHFPRGEVLLSVFWPLFSAPHFGVSLEGRVLSLKIETPTYHLLKQWPWMNHLASLGLMTSSKISLKWISDPKPPRFFCKNQTPQNCEKTLGEAFNCILLIFKFVIVMNIQIFLLYISV